MEKAQSGQKISFWSRALNPASKTYLPVFSGLWVILFLLYLPAEKAGWVSDTVQWLQKIRTEKFWDYVNAVQARGGLYQVTQIITWVIFRIFGSHPWPWHIIFITLQAANASLLFIITRKLFDEAGEKNGFYIALGASVLFCICPHISEVLIWKAAYHYLQALFFMLCILFWVQKFQSNPIARYAWYSGTLFLMASFTHEFFLLIPFFALTLALYYYMVLGYDLRVLKKFTVYFLIPFFLILALHFILLKISTGNFTADLGDEISQPLTGYLRKPPFFLFHILFFGRFFPHDCRQPVYDFFSGKIGLGICYGLLVIISLYILLMFRQISKPGKTAALFFLWMLACMALVSPMWFPEFLLVIFDRYLYFMLPFIYLLLVFFLVKINNKKLAVGLFTIYALVNISKTWQVNQYWRQSAYIVTNLVHTLPPAANKKVLLLNVPEYMNGAQMIGPFLNYSFRQMYNLYHDEPINNTMHDVISYNMSSPNDGVHIMVINDTLLHVTLNQWGTWWWNNLVGASSYENTDYKLNMIDPGHWYELSLKHPSGEYLLLYQTGANWKIVDMYKKSVDQY